MTGFCGFSGRVAAPVHTYHPPLPLLGCLAALGYSALLKASTTDGSKSERPRPGSVSWWVHGWSADHPKYRARGWKSSVSKTTYISFRYLCQRRKMSSQNNTNKHRLTFMPSVIGLFNKLHRRRNRQQQLREGICWFFSLLNTTEQKSYLQVL